MVQLVSLLDIMLLPIDVGLLFAQAVIGGIHEGECKAGHTGRTARRRYCETCTSSVRATNSAPSRMPLASTVWPTPDAT